MFPKTRSPPGAAKGPSSPGHPRDVLEEGAGQRGTVTSRATPSCGESLGDNGVCHRPLCWQNWGGERWFSPNTAEIPGNRASPTSQLDVPGGVKAALSAHLEDTKSSKVSGSITRVLLTPRGRDGAGPALETVRIYRRIHVEQVQPRGRAVGPPS